MRSSQHWLNPFTVYPSKKLKNLTWPRSSSKTNPAVFSAVCVPNDALQVQLRWKSIIGDPSFIGKKNDEEKNPPAPFRIFSVAVHFQNWNTGYGSEAIDADVQQLFPPHLPNEDEAPWPSILLYLLSGRHFLPPFYHPYYYRHPFDVSLYAFY